MIQIFLLLFTISDPDKVLQRLQHSLSENLKTLELFTNSQNVITDHQELLHLTQHLQNIKNKLDFLVLDVNYT